MNRNASRIHWERGGFCEQASQSVGENSALVYVYIHLGVRCLERRVAEMECLHAVFM